MNEFALYIGLYPTAAMTVLFGLSFSVFAIRWHLLGSADVLAESDEVRARGFFVSYFYSLIGPISRFLARLGVTPNTVTLSSLVMAVAGSYALAVGQFMIAAWLIVLSSATDAMDGFLARLLGIDSPAGAFLDSFVDRIIEGAFFMGFAYLGGGDVLTYLSIGALIASYAISYARARGASLGAEGKVGIMQRPARLTLVGLAIFILAWGQFFGGEQALLALQGATGLIGLLFLTASITAVRRARYIYDQLLPEDAGVEPIRPAPTDDEVYERAAG